MDIGEPIKEVEFEDPAAVPAPAVPAVEPAPVVVPEEQPVGV